MTCPTPMKVAFETKAQARKARDASVAAGVAMRVYLCPCGAYHLTSKGAEVKTCEYGPCDRKFLRHGEQRYCCQTHATKAKAKRQAERDRARLASKRTEAAA